MHDSLDFLQTLAIVLCVAAVTTVIFQRFKQPVVLGYLMAGMIVGPHVIVPLEADTHTVQILAELGVILLMFSLGLEFSISKLLGVGATAAFVALVQCSLMIWIGYIVGQIFGWSRLESFFAGAIISISSTTIIVKAFEEQGIRGGFTHVVFGILIVEDLIGILLITILTALSTGQELAAADIARTGGRLAAFLAALLIAGLLVVPRLMRAIVKLDRHETTIVASIGLAFGFSLLAAECGYSVALGAFIAGSLVAESGVEKTVEHLVRPIRDMFAAIFFVSVGMLIEPTQIAMNWLVVLVFLLAVIFGKILSVGLAAFLTGQGIQNSARIGMSVAQIGEFSFIIASVGVAGGAIDPLLYSMAIAVSAITTLLTPWLIRAAPATAAWIDRKLPHSIQTFAALYSSWIERLGSHSSEAETAPIRRAIRWLTVDVVAATVIIVGASMEMERITDWLTARWEVPEKNVRLIVIAGGILIASPFWMGAIRVARYLGFALANRVFPSSGRQQVDLAAAPRRLLVATLQLAIVVAIGVPLVAITQPFLPPFIAPTALLLVVVALAISFWRDATNLQGHTRAAAQAIIDKLTQQMQSMPAASIDSHAPDVDALIAGLGSPGAIEIRKGDPHVGKSLAELNLRGATGATVLAIRRGDRTILIPSGHDRLEAGDILALAGTKESQETARSMFIQR